MLSSQSNPEERRFGAISESTSQAIATRRLDRNPAKRRILRMVLDGKVDEEIARALGVHETSILRFRTRNADEIAELVARIESEAADYQVAHKVHRIADYDDLRSQLTAEIAERGIAWDEETRHGTKRHLSAAVDALLRTNKQAAEELDQLPRAGVNIAVQNTVIVKQVAGGENEELRRLAGG